MFKKRDSRIVKSFYTTSTGRSSSYQLSSNQLKYRRCKFNLIARDFSRNKPNNQEKHRYNFNGIFHSTPTNGFPIRITKRNLYMSRYVLFSMTSCKNYNDKEITEPRINKTLKENWNYKKITKYKEENEKRVSLINFTNVEGFNHLKNENKKLIKITLPNINNITEYL